MTTALAAARHGGRTVRGNAVHRAAMGANDVGGVVHEVPRAVPNRQLAWQDGPMALGFKAGST
jgi:hypothetical protein